MLLEGVKEREGWLISRWHLTNGVSWKTLCRAVAAAYPSFQRAEVLRDDVAVDLAGAEEILGIGEAFRLTLRGLSTIVHIPMMITFYNQTDLVDLALPKDGEEFAEADYERFNRSMCQFMDSLELMMYR